MATWSNVSKNTASWTAGSKNTSAWDSLGSDLLLQENDYLLLLESSQVGIDNGILLEQTTSISSAWANLTKN